MSVDITRGPSLLYAIRFLLRFLTAVRFTGNERQNRHCERLRHPSLNLHRNFRVHNKCDSATTTFGRSRAYCLQKEQLHKKKLNLALTYATT